MNSWTQTYKPIEGTIDEAEAFIESFMDEAGIPMKYNAKINVCMDEIYSNVVNYSGATEATIDVTYDDRLLTITISDDGIEYDPLAKEDPDITLSVEEREIGGLGIYITKKLMDNMIYRRKDGRNITTMSKMLI